MLAWRHSAIMMPMKREATEEHPVGSRGVFTDMQQQQIPSMYAISQDATDNATWKHAPTVGLLPNSNFMLQQQVAHGNSRIPNAVAWQHDTTVPGHVASAPPPGFPWTNDGGLRDAALQYMKAEQPSDHATTTCLPSWVDVCGNTACEPAHAPADIAWADPSGNSMAPPASSTWMDGAQKRDAHPTAEATRPAEWGNMPLFASDPQSAWDAQSSAQMRHTGPPFQEMHMPTRTTHDFMHRGFASQPLPHNYGHAATELVKQHSDGGPAAYAAYQSSSHGQLPAFPAIAEGGAVEQHPQYVPQLPFLAQASYAASQAAQEPAPSQAQAASPRMVGHSAPGLLSSQVHGGVASAVQHMPVTTASEPPSAWNNERVNSLTKDVPLSPDLRFEDFMCVFLDDLNEATAAEPEPVYRMQPPSSSPWVESLDADNEMDPNSDPFLFLADNHAKNSRNGDPAAAAIASAPHTFNRAVDPATFDRRDLKHGVASTSHRKAPAKRSIAMTHLSGTVSVRRSASHHVKSYSSSPGLANSGHISSSARMYDDREGKAVMIGGAAVMLGAQLQQPTVGSDGYIRKDSVLGEIIRVGRAPGAERGEFGREATLQEKVAAACAATGENTAYSVSNADSTHGGSTNRKRKAAAAVELQAMALDSSHHSTGRGTTRRKALTGLSTTEHIKSVMGVSEPPEVVEAILAWEAQQPRSGKWKGVNARQWGKVGIEIRLTGQSRHEGPVTAVGEQVARFADIVLTAAEAAAEQGGTASGGRNVSDGDKQSASLSSHSTGSPGQPSAHSNTLDRHASAPLAKRGVNDNHSGDCSAVTKVDRPVMSDGPVTGPSQRLIWRSRGKDKAWLGTYHTPVNAAVHHDFFKVVLAVEGKIFTSRDMDACNRNAGRQRPHLLKMNFPMDELPSLMRQSVTYTNLWHKYYQGSERYIFRDHDPAEVEKMVADFITQHCGQLREYIPPPPTQDGEGSQAQPRTQPRRASKAVARDHIRSFRSLDATTGADFDVPPPRIEGHDNGAHCPDSSA